MTFADLDKVNYERFNPTIQEIEEWEDHWEELPRCRDATVRWVYSDYTRVRSHSSRATRYYRPRTQGYKFESNTLTIDANDFPDVDDSSNKCNVPQCNGAKYLHGTVFTHEFVPYYRKNIRIPRHVQYDEDDNLDLVIENYQNNDIVTLDGNRVYCCEGKWKASRGGGIFGF